MDPPTQHETGRPPTAVDLFAGCGGLTTGLVQAGFNVLAAVEFEPKAVTAYEANYPDVLMYPKNIRTLKGETMLHDLKIARGDLDLLAGCPPCQGFSRMRTLNGRRTVEDPRNDLVAEYYRLVSELLPHALLLENVPAFLDDGRFVEFMRKIRLLGYAPTTAVHDAASFRVPQRRRRMIMLALRGGEVAMPTPDPKAERRTVKDAIGHLAAPGSTNDPAHDVTEARSPAVRELISKIPHDGGSRRAAGAHLQLECHKKCDGFSDVYGRMWWNTVSPTITSGFVNPSKGRFLHPNQDRCITPREAALLQTFPANYSFPMAFGKYPVAEMIGNAFPPELARRHAVAVYEALRPVSITPPRENRPPR